jgi:hypothetical protein
LFGQYAHAAFSVVQAEPAAGTAVGQTWQAQPVLKHVHCVPA